MKKKIVTVMALCLMLHQVDAQISDLRGRVKVPKITDKSGTQAKTDSNSGGSKDETAKKFNEDESEAQTERAYYFNDKNAELTELYNQKDYMNRPEKFGPYCRQILLFSLNEVKEKIADSENRWPEIYNSDFWVIYEFKPKLVDFGTSMMETHPASIQQYLTESDKFFVEGNYLKALYFAQCTDSLALAMVTMNRENQEAKLQRDKTQQQIIKIKAKLSTYYTSSFHADHAGEIMFSRNKISAGSETETAMTTAFSGSDDIYASVYLNGRIKDYSEKNMFIQVQLEGVNYAVTFEYPVTENMVNETVITVPLVSAAGDTKFIGTEAIVNMLAEHIKPGLNNVTISVLTHAQRNGGEWGEVCLKKITIDGSASERLIQLREDYYRIKVANARVPKAVTINAALESDFKKLSAGLFTEEVTALRASIQSEWNMVYHEYSGQPLSRYMYGFIVFKVPRTGKCYYRAMKIGQDYVGGSKYGSSYLYDAYSPADLIEIECENVNK